MQKGSGYLLWSPIFRPSGSAAVAGWERQKDKDSRRGRQNDGQPRTRSRRWGDEDTAGPGPRDCGATGPALPLWDRAWSSSPRPHPAKSAAPTRLGLCWAVQRVGWERRCGGGAGGAVGRRRSVRGGGAWGGGGRLRGHPRTAWAETQGGAQAWSELLQDGQCGRGGAGNRWAERRGEGWGWGRRS